MPYHNVKNVQLVRGVKVSHMFAYITVSVPLVVTNENRYLAKQNIGSANFSKCIK